MPRIAHRVDHGWRNRSVFGALGLRPAQSEHTEAEGELLRRYARGKRSLVEIGVAEGGSAWEARTVMAEDATLTLIDPYHLSNLGRWSPARIVAQRVVDSVDRGTVEWVAAFSHDAAQDWQRPIDFLFIDGDHSLEGVRQDWNDWAPHVTPDGIVCLHDANTDAPWVGPDDGPVRLIAQVTAGGDWVVAGKVDSLVALSRPPAAARTGSGGSPP